jgi:hypothetical protein
MIFDRSRDEVNRCETWSLTLREEHRLRMFEKQGAEENIWTEER